MAITLDANLGTAVSVAATNTVVLTTGAPVAAGGLILLAAACDPAGVPLTIVSVSGGGLVWTIDQQAQADAPTQEALGAASAPAPAGLAASTPITVTFSGSPTSKMVGAISVLGADVTSSRVDGIPPAVHLGTSTAWAMNPLTVAAGSIVIAVTVSDSAGAMATTAPAGALEAFEVPEATNGNNVCLGYLISSAGGSITISGTETGNDNATIAVAYKVASAAAPAATFRSVRAFQEETDPRAFQPQAFQRPDPGKAFEENNGTLGYGFGFQPAAFQRPDATGALQDTGFQASAFQDDFDAFQLTVFQGDAFQEGVRPAVSFAGLVVSGVGAIPSGEAFGTTRVLRILSPVAVASAEAFGTTKLIRQLLNAGAISSAEAFGVTRTLRILGPPGIASLETLGAPKTVRLLGQVAIVTGETFGTTKALRILLPQAIVGADTVTIPKTLRILGPVGISSGEAVGRPTTIGGILGVIISGVGAIPSGEAFGQADRIIRILAPIAVVSGQAFGTTRTIRILGNAGAIATAGAFGQPKTLRILGQVSIASGELFGRPTVIGGVVFVVITGVGAIPSGEAFGQADKVIRILGPAGVTTGVAFGNNRAVRILGNAGAIPGAATVGANDKVSRVLAAVGVTSAEAFGTTKTIRVVRAVNITTGEAFGVATVSPPVPPGTLRPDLVFVIDGETWIVTVSDAEVLDITVGQDGEAFLAFVSDLEAPTVADSADGAPFTVQISDVGR